ncbi:MAG: TolC family protein [Bacteroidetes bacterium]|nr:TolC family protein [Bacteroidota bacterium]
MKINKYSKIFVILFSIILFDHQIFPQQRDTLILSLDEAITKALDNNWDIQISKKDIQKSQEQIDEAYSNAFPRIDFTGNYTRNIKLPVLFIPPDNAFNPTHNTLTMELGSKNSFSGTIGLTQVLYSQKVNTAIQIAGEYSEFSKAGNQATQEEVILSVKKNFYTILLAKQLVKVSKENYEAAKANFENVSALFKQGVASEYDYLRSEVQAANTQPMLIQSENNLNLAKSSLKNLLTINIDQPFDIKGEFVFQEVPQEIILENSQDAINRSPLVKQLELQESLLDKNISIQRADYFPTLALFGQYQFQTQDNTLKINRYLWPQSFMVGLQISYLLFDGFSRSARVQQAIIDKEKISLGRKKLEEGLKVQVLQAQMKMNESKKRVQAQEKSLQQADKALKIANTRYKSGVGTQLEIIDTQAALTFAQTNYFQAIYDYLIAKSEWEYAVSINSN